MRVAFVLGLPNPAPGAAWTRIASFARRLRAEGHRADVVGVVTPKHLDRAGVRATEAATVVNLCPAVHAPGAIAWLFNLAASLVVLPLVLVALRPDVVVVSVPSGAPIVGGVLGARVVQARVVVDYRDEWEAYAAAGERSFGRRVLRALAARASEVYRTADRVIAVSEPLAETLRARGVRDVRVVPNGADTGVFRPRDRHAARAPLSLRDDEYVLAYEGTIGYYYRLDAVVRAMASAGPATRLLLAGPDPEGQLRELRGLADALGMPDALVYLGVKDSPEALAEALAAADVGLVPYDANPLWRHALPAKFFEYAACGLPVLATVPEDSVLAQLIRTRDVGRTVPPADVPALAGAIRAWREDPSEARRLGENGRRLVVESFDRTALAERFVAELRPLLGGQR